jgi:hypothetical protein
MMSDVEIVDLDDNNQVVHYTPIESKRGVKKYWKVVNNASCVNYINGKLKVSLFYSADADIALGVVWF